MFPYEVMDIPLHGASRSLGRDVTSMIISQEESIVPGVKYSLLGVVFPLLSAI